MTSPSLKNHPTTVSLTTTRSSGRSLWKRCLAGALCLMVSGVIPANDQEVAKPLDRLKLRSARQRWRELRGEWKPAPDVSPQTPASELPIPAADPFSGPTRKPTAPKPAAVTGSTIEEPRSVRPIPSPISAPISAPTEQHPVVARPRAMPSTDSVETLFQEGSFGEVVLETHVATPRARMTIPLPHWPFGDDLDLVPLPPVEEDPVASVDPESALPVASELFSPTTDAASPVVSLPEVVSTPEQPVISIPIQVAEVPAVEVPVAEVPAPAAIPAAPVVEAPPPQPVATPASVPQPKPVIAYKMRSIKEIQPFDDYVAGGGDTKTANTKRPEEKELELQGSLERNHSIIPIYWQASNVSHNPLYFEDSGLERNGHSFSDVVQPFVSVGKFGAQVVALPYSIALDPVWQRETPLGHYRPGECAPKRHLALPINGRSAVVAAATYTGIIYLIQ